jgi:hypothetical protein
VIGCCCWCLRCGWLMPLVSAVWLADAAGVCCVVGRCRWYLLCGWLMPLVCAWLADAAGICCPCCCCCCPSCSCWCVCGHIGLHQLMWLVVENTQGEMVQRLAQESHRELADHLTGVVGCYWRGAQRNG